MKDFTKLANKAVRLGADSEEMARLSVEADSVDWSWFKGTKRMVLLAKRDEARKRLLELTGG